MPYLILQNTAVIYRWQNTSTSINFTSNINIMLHIVTFKVKKFYKIRTCLKKKTTICIRLWANHISLKYLKEIFFFVNFGWDFYYFKSKFLSEVSTLRYKIILKKFSLHFISICVSSKSASQILKMLFQTGHNNIFILCCVIFIIHFQKN